MEQFIICRLNGLGHTLVEGNTAGFWAYLMNDATVEGYQSKCQGRKDPVCKMIFAPINTLSEKKHYFGDTDYSGLELSREYEQLNQIKPLQSSNVSLLDLINSKVFKYHGGFIEKTNERFFNIGSTFFYLLEKELKKLESGNKLLFDVSFEFGEKFIQDENEQGIIDYLSAFGWGDTIIRKNQGKISVLVNYFPWTRFASEIDFSFYRGFLSGMLSKSLGKKIILQTHNFSISSGFMTLTVGE